jgi:hypothetical protein
MIHKTYKQYSAVALHVWHAFLETSHNSLVSLIAINTKQEDYFSERMKVVIVA